MIMRNENLLSHENKDYFFRHYTTSLVSVEKFATQGLNMQKSNIDRISLKDFVCVWSCEV